MTSGPACRARVEIAGAICSPDTRTVKKFTDPFRGWTGRNALGLALRHPAATCFSWSSGRKSQAAGSLLASSSHTSLLAPWGPLPLSQAATSNVALLPQAPGTALPALFWSLLSVGTPPCLAEAPNSCPGNFVPTKEPSLPHSLLLPTFLRKTCPKIKFARRYLAWVEIMVSVLKPFLK